jgi:hypothetical protein
MKKGTIQWFSPRGFLHQATVQMLDDTLTIVNVEPTILKDEYEILNDYINYAAEMVKWLKI